MGASTYSSSDDVSSQVADDFEITYTSTSISGIYLGLSGKGNFSIVNSSGAYCAVGGSDINDGNWHQISATYNGSLMRLYIDGSLAATNASYSGSLPSSSQFFVGAFSSSDYFNGSIDEVRIYNRSLSAQEVWLHYQTEFAKYNSTTYLFYANLTNLSSGTYTYYGWANDSAGNSAYTNVYSASSPRYLIVSLNQAPTVHDVVFSDSDGGSVQLSVNDDAVVNCNATIVDTNGYQDVSTFGGANATLYYNLTSNATAFDDKNLHYTNSSCSFTGGDSNNVTVVCIVVLEHEALNGTWTCNITAWDAARAAGSGRANNSVDQIIALEILEPGISFGSMGLGASSSVANSTNITNKGNVLIDIQVKGDTDLSCALGTLGVGNISYNVSSGGYDTMSSKRLSTDWQSETAFDLGIEGVATAEDVNSTKNEYWTINIPSSGVRGVCNNTVTVAAVIG